MFLTRESFITSVHNHLNLPKKRCADLVESLLEIIKSTLGWAFSGERRDHCAQDRLSVIKWVS